jgi:hypothetical protein
MNAGLVAICECSEVQNPPGDPKTATRPRPNSYATLCWRYRCLGRWSDPWAVRPDVRPHFGIGRTCFATRASMHFEGECDCGDKCSQCIAEVMVITSPRGTETERSCYRAKTQRDGFRRYVRTKGATATELEHRMYRSGPLPSLCRSDSGRRLEQEVSLIDCHLLSTARQVLTV